MGENTRIGWCQHSFNIWEGCDKVYLKDANGDDVPSECENCYAEARNKRFNGGENWGPGTPRLGRSDSYWRQPPKWNRKAAKLGKRHRVFCSSLADVFELHDDPEINAWMDDQRERLWSLIEETPHLDWMLLTKRPENIEQMIPPAWWDYPRDNVWLGVTAGTQAAADLRIPILLQTPAAVRFVSCEPLLERVDLSRYMWPVCRSWPARYHGDWQRAEAEGQVTWHRQGLVAAGCRFIDQVIVGCESGFGARPFDLDWVRSVRDQCQRAGVAFFLKQIPVPGRHGKVETEPEIDGKRWTEMPR